MWRGGDEVTQAFLPVVWQGYWSGGDRQECLSHFWGAVGTDRNVYLTFAVRWGQAGMSISLLGCGGDRQECLSHATLLFRTQKSRIDIHDAAFER